MATTTPKLNLPRPEGHDNVTRANQVDLIDAIDENAASQAELDDVRAIAEGSIPKSGGTMTGPLRVENYVDFQGVKKYHFSRSGTPPGIVEIGRMTISESHDQVWIVGKIQHQTGNRTASSRFDILIRTTTNATIDAVRIYQDCIDNSESARTEVRVYTRDVSGGSEVVLCVNGQGDQFVAYSLEVFTRRAAGYAFSQSNMNQNFSTTGYTEHLAEPGMSRFFSGQILAPRIVLDSGESLRDLLQLTRSGSSGGDWYFGLPNGRLTFGPGTMNSSGNRVFQFYPDGRITTNGRELLPARFSNGRFEVYDGGSWKAVGGLEVTRPRVASFHNASTPIVDEWIEVVNVSGSGKLFNCVWQDTGAGVNVLQIEIRIDGVTSVLNYPVGDPLLLDSKAVSITGDFTFRSGLRVRVRREEVTGSGTQMAYVEYGLE